MIVWGLLLLIAGAACQETTNSTTPALSCPVCRCYAVDCSILANPDIDCQEEYTDTCESGNYIVDDNGCSQLCDCCLQGTCLKWSDYYCFIYRAYQLLSVIFFVALLVGHFLLQGLHRHFFSVSRLWPATQKSVDWENDPKVLNIRFKQRVAVEYKHEYDKRISAHKGFYRARDLFEDIKTRQPLAVRNLIYFGAVTVFYLGMAALTGYTIFGVPTAPRTFAYIFWELVICGIAFFVMAGVGFFKMPTYAEEVLQLIVEFERNFKCKIQVLDKVKVFQFRFKKEKNLVPKNPLETVGSFADLNARREAPQRSIEGTPEPSGDGWEEAD